MQVWYFARFRDAIAHQQAGSQPQRKFDDQEDL